METYKYTYRFLLPDGRSESFELQFDAETLEPVDEKPEALPPWTRLGFRQCANCTLSPDRQPFCPVAARLVRLVVFCEGLQSYDNVGVEVAAFHRTTAACMSAQEGISSVMGLIIATSGCPHTVFFSTMARFHQPFATHDETVLRAASTYLLMQYFRRQEGHHAELEVHGLEKIYRAMHVVNTGLAERLRAAIGKDSSVNALIVLDSVANMLPGELSETLKELGYLFKPSLKAIGGVATRL